MESLSPNVSFILIVLLFTAFAKIYTALSIMSVGVGIRGLGFSAIVAALSLLLSFVVMKPYLGEEFFFGGAGGMSAEQIGQLKKKLTPFMQAHADTELQQTISDLQSQIDRSVNGQAALGTDAHFTALGAAFFVTQLRDAFFLGLLFLIPFLVVDLIVTNGMMLLGITQMPVPLVALPLKLLIFVLIDGWGLVSQRVLSTFIGG